MTEPLRIDIVSDVVCPWCAVGYYQLKQALEAEGIAADIHWHPFELNPQMGPEGQDIVEHVAEKYGSTPGDSKRARERLTAAGGEVGFTFRYADDMRIWNTFRAHRLLHWAEDFGKVHDLKLALLRAYFTDGKTVDDPEVLADVAADVGLDRDAAMAVVTSNDFTDEVRAMQHFWISKGIRGVPAMVFDSKHLVTGARGVDVYAQFLRQLQAAKEVTA